MQQPRSEPASISAKQFVDTIRLTIGYKLAQLSAEFSEEAADTAEPEQLLKLIEKYCLKRFEVWASELARFENYPDNRIPGPFYREELARVQDELLNQVCSEVPQFPRERLV